MAYWLKQQHSLRRIVSSSISYGVLAQVAAQLLAYWLKYSSTAYGVLSLMPKQFIVFCQLRSILSFLQWLRDFANTKRHLSPLVSQYLSAMIRNECKLFPDAPPPSGQPVWGRGCSCPRCWRAGRSARESPGSPVRTRESTYADWKWLIPWSR